MRKGKRVKGNGHWAKRELSDATKKMPDSLRKFFGFSTLPKGKK